MDNLGSEAVAAALQRCDAAMDGLDASCYLELQVYTALRVLRISRVALVLLRTWYLDGWV